MRIVGNVHLAVLSGYFSVGVNSHGSIVVNFVSSALKKRRYYYYVQFLCQGAECVGLGRRNAFREPKLSGVQIYAKIFAHKELLRAYDFCAIRCRRRNHFGLLFQIIRRILRRRKLCQRDFHKLK